MKVTTENLNSKKAWEHIQGLWSTDYKKPKHVFVSEYEYEDWSGSGQVIFYDKGKVYDVTGSHCSCYGLEGQFTLDHFYTIKEYLKVLDRQIELNKENGWHTDLANAKSLRAKVKAFEKKLAKEKQDRLAKKAQTNA